MPEQTASLDLLELDQVSAVVRRPARTVRKMIVDGNLPAIAIGKRYLVPRYALEEWIRTQCRPQA